MKYLIILIFFSVNFIQSSNAQKNKLINSGEIIRKCTKLYDSGEYKTALTELKKINRSDTNYVWSLYEKAKCSEADSQYTQAIKYCQEALALKEQRELEAELYNTYGIGLNGMGEYPRALKVFDVAISRFPRYSFLYYNKGLAQLALNKPAEAAALFQKTLVINPYMYSAHYQLGIAALKQGKIVPSFLSFIGYLLVNPEGKYISKSVNFLIKIANGTDEVLDFKNKRTEPIDANYRLVEDIILSKIALDKAYKPIIALDDPVCRQIQATFEKLEYSADDKDFWIQYYLPFFKNVYNDGSFEVLINHIFSNAKNATIQEFNRKNKREMASFSDIAGAYFNNIRATGELNYKYRDSIKARYYFENGSCVGKGALTNGGKTLIGPWEFYYSSGNLKSKGVYNDKGVQDGEWSFYFLSGNIKAREFSKDGKLEGKQAYYFENGNLSSEENFSNGLLTGTLTSYYYSGNKSSVSNYKMDKKEGEERNFYSNGNLLSVSIFAGGVLNGNYTEYFKSGHKKEIQVFVNGKSEGFYKSYFESGLSNVEGQNIKDNATGEWKYYYESGKIKEKRNFVNNIENGVHISYYENGITSALFNLNNGKMNGDAIYYDKDGKVYCKYAYDDGILKSINYYDKSGKVISTSEKGDNSINVISYLPSGLKKEHAYFNLKGELEGPDTIYFPSGKINQVNNYLAGQLNGVSVTYYLNGNKKYEVNLTKGKENGYCSGYYFNGRLKLAGWIVDGQNEGEWLTFDDFGRLISKSNYLAGDLNGYKEDFLPNGKRTIEEKYHRGWLEKMTQFDTTGKVLTVDSFPKANGKYVLVYPGGKTMMKINYVNGDFDGQFQSFYFDGSLQTTYYLKKGLRDSTFTSYYFGGQKNTEGWYAWGNKTGIWKQYDEDGKLIRTTSYAKDQLNGESVYYNKNGAKDFVAYYKDDLLTGVTEKYDQEGTLAYQVNFDDGSAKAYSYLGHDGKLIPFIPISTLNGNLKSFFPNGKPSRECSYTDGAENGQDIIYYPNGQIRSLDTLAYGITMGVSKEFNSNGKPKSYFDYVLNQTNGVCREYNNDGILKKEYTFDNGINHGPVKYFDNKGKLSRTFLYYYGTLIAVKNEQ